MAISPSISIPSASSFPATFAKPSPNPLFATRRFLSGEKKPKFLVLLSGDRRLLAPARARAKEVVLGSPSVTVEKGKYSYEVETLINKLSSLPPRGSIARCLDMCKNKLSLNDFALVFKEFAQRGDWQRSLRLFKYMQRQIWCKPNEHIYTIMISLLGREGLLEKAAEVFDEMPAQSVARSVFSYTALINAYGRNGKYQEALDLLERMKRDRVPPSILTYNTVINACSRGGLDWEGLLGLFAEMRHEGVQPDLATYNTLLGACAARKLGDEAEMVFRTMNGGGTVVPDRTTYRCLVETFGKLGSLETVSGLLREMESGGNSPDITSYNVLLEAYAEKGSTVEAVGVFRQMQEAGCPPNAHTYSTLLNLYGRNGRYDDVRELFLEMKVSNTEPDAATYNILIGVFGEGGYFKEVVTLFHDMVDENVEPNIETYEGLLAACGKGGLHEDAKAILTHASSRGVVPSSRAYTGVVEAYGQAALYEEAIVTFNTMNEVGSIPGLETFESLIGAFSRGGLYLEAEALVAKMGAIGEPRTVGSFNGLVEAFRQGGRFEDAVRAYGEMGKAKCSPDERTFESLLSVYCFAGLVEESEEHFEVIKASGINPSVMCYCMMIAVYARGDRWDEAFQLLDEMLSNKASNMHQVIGQMIKGDFDDGSNWQMVEYVFDKLNSEGCGFGIRFYNTLLEALWWMGQKERAARVLNEATKRGLFPELFRRNKLVWSIDVHRMWEGGACTALSVWLNDMLEMFLCGEDLPHLATVVVVRGKLERSPAGQETPVAKAAHSFLQENVFSSFDFPAWNKGRLVCQRAQLKQILMGLESPSDGSAKTDKIVSLQNSFPLLGTRMSTTTGANIGHPSNSRTELVTSSI